MNMHATISRSAAPAATIGQNGPSVLAERAVLARPSIAVWTARKFDRRATADTIDAAGAAGDAGRFNKALLSRDALRDVTTAASRAREYHYDRTLPWSDDGARILPTPLYTEYADRMRALRHEFDAAVAAFLAGYPDYREAARGRLGSMFDPADYPTEAAIRRKFDFSIGIDPIPSGADFRVSIGDAVREDVERRVRETTAAAMADALRRVADVVGTMAGKLAAYVPPRDGAGAAGVFRDSLIGNVRELAARVAALAEPEADTLRSDDIRRAEIAREAAEITAEAERIAADAAAWF